MFQVRIHCIDYCLAAPTKADFAASRAPIVKSAGSNSDHGQPEKEVQVPVIRIFGATTTGQIACVHIHGVFPYLYVPFGCFSFGDSDRIIASLRVGIDQAVGRVAVVAITLVRGIPFYGLHVGFCPYLKIYLYDPGQLSRVADLLRKGRIAGIPELMPHEAHIPFLLQFMTDYNLYGCDLLDVSEVTARPSDSAARKSCPVEVDISACNIVNRHAVPERWQHEALPELLVKKDERLVHSLAALWREMAAKYNKKGKKSAEERKTWEIISTQDAFAQLGASSSDPRRTPAPWIHEEEYREQIADIIALEQAQAAISDRPRELLEKYLPTTRQSVEDFYPKTSPSDMSKRKREHCSDQQECLAKLELDDALSCVKKARPEIRLSGSIPSPSPDFDQQLNAVLAEHDAAARRPTLSNEWLHSQKSKPRSSQELPSRRKQKSEPRESHRPLSQSFPVVKSAFPQNYAKTPQTLPSSNTTETGGDTRATHLSPEHPFVHGTLAGHEKNKQNFDIAVAVAPNTLKPSRHKVVKTNAVKRSQSRGPFYHVSDTLLAISKEPPSVTEVMASLDRFGPDEIHQDAHFSADADVPRTKAGQPGIGISAPFLPKFATSGSAVTTDGVSNPFFANLDTEQPSIYTWELALLPPSREEVQDWLDREDQEKSAQKQTQDQEASATQQQMSKGQLTQVERAALRKPSAMLQLDIRTLCLEVHANSRGTFLPNPERDAVQYVFWRCSGGGDIPTHAEAYGLHIGDKNGGVISVARPLRDDFVVDVVSDEQELIHSVIDLVHVLDPDLLAGYEILGSSWGYLSERAALHGIDLYHELSRVAQSRVVPFHEHNQGVTGRYMLSINQAIRSDVDLRQYTLESSAWHILGRRVPFYRASVLTAWATTGSPKDFSRLARHYRRRTAINLALIDATELVARTSEQARVLGIDFASVINRGSQFKVESVMLRVAKPENFVLPSPSKEQVGQQNAAECQPLVLEPRSAFYSSPVVVLDFTSLYPSLMIAYNICYSTYVGRLDPMHHEKKLARAANETVAGDGIKKDASWPTNGANDARDKEIRDDGFLEDMEADAMAKHQEKSATKMGFTTYKRPSGLLERLSHLGLVVSPTGHVYAGAKTRQSLLAKMLAEILDTRAMVKAAMKKTPAAKVAERQRLNNRQLALKLLANVTYGYTSATFSGRMPCVEVADSIVQTGRQTLDKAIALIHSVRRWNAEVVYGDTDSLFIHLPGRTREQAFKVGAEMAEAVTASNPHPVRLKFEKVYHPCVLLAKKRYVGYAFDTPQQAEPVFDAKGIETVRRDGSPASAKVLEECLRILFDSSDLSRVKTYLQARFDDVMNDRLSIADLCFAREVRAPSSYRAPPPGAIIASRRMAHDPRASLVHGERVPYVVVAGPPGMPLRDRCVAPEEVVKNRHLRLDSDYYIQNSLIPPLVRIFRLVDVDVLRWYLEMPKARMPLRSVDPAPTQQVVPGGTGTGASYVGQQTLDTWLRGSRCARCDQPVRIKRRRGPLVRGPLCTGIGPDAATSVSSANATENEGSVESDSEGKRFGPGTGQPLFGILESEGDVRLGLQNDNSAPVLDAFAGVAVGGRFDQGVAKMPVLCKSCGKDNLGTLIDLQNRARDAERAYQEILTGCRSCAGLGPREAVRCENLTCAVYFVRAERAVQAKIEHAKAPLVSALALRGMRDLEW